MLSGAIGGLFLSVKPVGTSLQFIANTNSPDKVFPIGLHLTLPFHSPAGLTAPGIGLFCAYADVDINNTATANFFIKSPKLPRQAD
jgi:hypothetical protein